MSAEWDKVNALIDGLVKATGDAAAPPRVRALAPYVNTLQADFLAKYKPPAGTTRDDGQLPGIERTVRSTWLEVEHATGQGVPRSWRERLFEQFSIGGLFGIAALALVLGIVGGTILLLLYKHSDWLTTVNGTRPLLTIAAVISTLAFGGALVFGALFSSEGTFAERFRMAREIFLVFSGMFGTVVGFHFGAGQAAPPQAEAAAGPVLAGVAARDGRLVLRIDGGSAPYTARVEHDGAVSSASGDSPLAVALKGAAAGQAIQSLAITVKDKEGRSGQHTLSNVMLQGQLWPPPAASPASAGSAPPPASAGGSAPGTPASGSSAAKGR